MCVRGAGVRIFLVDILGGGSKIKKKSEVKSQKVKNLFSIES